MSVWMTVLLVDDHAVVREGYRRLLEESGRILIAGEATNAIDAIEQSVKLAPRIIIMDVSLPGISGIEATRRIRICNPHTSVLIFSMHEEPIFARRALEAGARGYVSKINAPKVLLEAVDVVASGQRYLSEDIAQKLALSRIQNDDQSVKLLSSREFEVLRLLVDGFQVEYIAHQLDVSAKTVANARCSIKQKLGVETGMELVRAAIRLGLVRIA
jgi:two-component system, NarL family, invasion response regulator UvrY